LAFTTWAALKTQMEQDLANGQALTQSYTVDGTTRTFRTFDDWQKFYGFVSSRAAQESAPSVQTGRAYARPRGRF